MTILTILSIAIFILGIYCGIMFDVHKLKSIGAEENGEIELYLIHKKKSRQYLIIKNVSMILFVISILIWYIYK